MDTTGIMTLDMVTDLHSLPTKTLVSTQQLYVGKALFRAPWPPVKIFSLYRRVKTAAQGIHYIMTKQ